MKRKHSLIWFALFTLCAWLLSGCGSSPNIPAPISTPIPTIQTAAISPSPALPSPALDAAPTPALDTVLTSGAGAAMPGGLPEVYPESKDLNEKFMTAKLLPDVYWETDNKTDLPKKTQSISIPSGRLAFAFIPTRPREEKSIAIDDATLKSIISEVNEAAVLLDSSQVDWAQADFQDYWLNLYILTDGGVYNCISFWGPILYKKEAYVNVSVQSIGGAFAFENWRIESSRLGQILVELWGAKFDLERLSGVTRIDMRVLEPKDKGNTAMLEGEAAKDMAGRILKTAEVVTGYGKCGYTIEVCFSFSDGTTELGWLNGDSCPGIAMDNGPNLMFDKEITRELYQLLGYGKNFIG